ncbi:MAG: lipoprotein insertase outer membrane protein LolB, partial [Casimicrobiaceae bacterium]
VRACVAAAFMLGILAACATLPAPVTESSTPRLDAPFAIDGRLSARRGTEGVAGSFSWFHEPGRDAIDLATPLGQTLARLDGDRDGVKLALPDGSVETASDWASLTQRGLGVAIPVGGLAWWIQGRPRPGPPATVERDADGRTSTLRQDGWDVHYHYADGTATRATRLTLAYPDSPPIDLTIVIDRRQ